MWGTHKAVMVTSSVCFLPERAPHVCLIPTGPRGIRSSGTEAMGMLEQNSCGSFLQPLWLFERRSLLILLVVILRQPRFHRPDSDVQFVDLYVSTSQMLK